jgi:hypothetical protein
MPRAMNHGRERMFSDRKETHWGKRKLKPDAQVPLLIGCDLRPLYREFNSRRIASINLWRKRNGYR